jgi:hypothetical protein
VANPITDREYLDSWLSGIASTIAVALRTLLQDRHLYQSVTVPLDIVPTKDTRLQNVALGQWFPEGQTLAGLFLLRTFIEQFVKASTGIDRKADEVLDTYMAELPQDFKTGSRR